MALRQTPISQLGVNAQPFNLLGVDEKYYSLEDVKGGNGLLVMFICNHCPYVKAIISRLVVDAKELQDEGIGIVAIMPNATEIVPEDSYNKMKKFSAKNDFNFPYLIDKKQEVSRSYKAICTPDFFGFNSHLELQYRGRLDDSERNLPKPDIKRDLLEAMVEVKRTGKGPEIQSPSIGCSIKWR
jgi:peroxiredoxin